MSEEGVQGSKEKARRVLQAVAVETHGRPGAYVIRDRAMGRANIADPAEFFAVAEYLQSRGWIAEGDSNYDMFAVTTEGIDEAAD